MNDKTVIKVEKLSKKFCSNLRRSMLYGTINIGRSIIGIQHDSDKLRKGEFWALQDINFELKKGEIIGLIGKNGSGKTTLLRLLNGIFPPDKGKITIEGRIGSLIALGAGFHPHMTGRENIFLNGTILGMSKSEIKSKLEEIIDFADIEEFIDAPVATYSSGMTVRLGFAIAIHCQPDILLIDEVLAVGDYNFQYKCFEKIKELKRNGTSIVFVSHSEGSVKAICSRGILMDHGRVVIIDEVDKVFLEYNKQNTEHIKQVLINKYNKGVKLTEEEFNYRRGNGKVRFSEVAFCDMENNKINSVKFGTEKIRIYAKYFAEQKIENVKIGFYLRDAKDNEKFCIYGANLNTNVIDYVEGEGEFYFDFDIRDLGPNLYGLYLNIWDNEVGGISYDVWDINGTILEVESNLEMIKSGFSISKPYIIRDVNVTHVRL
ncbi:MAG: ABC transporter ATP-binding protein [Bacteroidales bacterium]|nr:ABC transporter ATP-binding protein [Bacteroidales bacterium]